MHSDLVDRVFFNFARLAAERMQRQGGRFVYYTTAATALKILRDREIWMRNAMTMNDFSEVEHGLSCIEKAYASSSGRALRAELDGCFDGMAAEVDRSFQNWTPAIRSDTFVTCLSEHDSAEDLHGRLSMWRAYGGLSGVAIVIRGESLFGESNVLGAYTSPVAYLDPNRMAKELEALAARIRESRSLLKALQPQDMKTAMFHVLRYAAISTKHPAFSEEREWRVVATPSFEASDLLPQQVEDVSGVPQIVLKIKLENFGESGLNLAPKSLIDRILVGPCEHADAVARAFRQSLEELGVEDAATKVNVTGIPLRVGRI